MVLPARRHGRGRSAVATCCRSGLPLRPLRRWLGTLRRSVGSSAVEVPGRSPVGVEERRIFVGTAAVVERALGTEAVCTSRLVGKRASGV